MKLLVLIGFFCLISMTLGAKSYSGYQVIRIEIPDSKSAEYFKQLESQHEGLDFWKDPYEGKSADLMVSPDLIAPLRVLLSSRKFKHEILIKDVQPLIERQNEKSNAPNPRADYELTFDAYYPLSTFYEYFDWLEANFDFVQSETIGQSYEGRDMRVMKVCYPDGICGNKPGMWIDAGVHAREWIAHATSMFSLQELVENNTLHQHLTEHLGKNYLIF